MKSIIENIGPQVRWKYFIPGVILVFVLAWYFAFSKTFTLYSTYNQLEEKAQYQQEAPRKAKEKKKELEKVNQYVGFYIRKKDSETFRILENITNAAKGKRIKVTSIPQKQRYTAQGFVYETIAVSVEGSFNDCLDVLYQLEYIYKPGRIVSSDFKMIRDPYLKTEKLVLTMYIQTIEESKETTE